MSNLSRLRRRSYQAGCDLGDIEAAAGSVAVPSVTEK
jgi:hypothetical protein